MALDKNIIPGIQYLRGLAALAVLLCHASFGLKNHQFIADVLNYGQLGVHVFFFISGYVITLSLLKTNYHPKYFFKFLLKRSIRIDPVYLFTIFLTLFSFWIITFFPTFKGKSIPFIPGQFLAHVFYIVPFTKWDFYNHVFWTLSVEFQFYILIGCLYFLNNSIFFRVAFLILFSATCFISLPSSYYLLTNYTALFALGMATMHYQNTKHWAYLATMFLCSVIICYHFSLLVLALVIIAILMIAFMHVKLSLLNFLGTISYSLYIIHPLVLLYINSITKRIYPNVNDYELIYLFVQLLTAIGFAYVFYLAIERPAIKLSKRLNYSLK